jgi:Ricin-type beta-trefoil lectin domain/Putative Ig domain/Subtilase family
MSLIASVRLGRALAAVAGLGILGLSAPATAPAATVRDVAADRPAAASRAVAAPAVPASARFVAAARTAATASGVRHACAVPVRPGQMMCMALVRARAMAAGPAAVPPSGAYDPADLQEAYGLASAAATAGDGQVVAVVDAYRDPSARKDLAAYRAEYGLTACTSPPAGAGCLTIANQAGHAGPLPASDPSGGWELEESLDLDMVSAICPNCGILLVEARSASISNLAIAERYAARNASVVSNSWGSGAEFTGENSFDAYFRRSGVPIVAAAGDSGYGTQYPAASQFVTAVGGTTLTGATSTSPGIQRAWAGTGSGCSALEARPSWQTSTGLVPGGCRNRTEADVSADANPVPGVAVFATFPDEGTASGWTALGGTSVATPIIASVYALAGGLVAGTYPASYPYLDTAGLTDVTAGSNGSCEPDRRYLCRAAAGYDGPTGLGTPAGPASFAGPAGPAVTVTDPGTRDYRAGASVRLRIRALDSGGSRLSYAVTGLPAGLRLNSADGLISGKLTSTPESRGVKVTVTDGNGGSGSVTFAFVVVAPIADRHPGSGPVSLHLDDKCLTDTGDSAAGGTKVEISTCDGSGSQRWEYIPLPSPGAAGLVKIHGKCLSIRTGTANGARATLQSCAGSAGQRWAYQSLDHLYNPKSGKCLDDPGTSGKNGTQAELWSCGGTAGESWTLPPAPVLSGLAGQCLTDPGDSAWSGTRVEIQACSGSSSQRWVMERGGTLRIRGKCLNVSRGGLMDGAAVDLADCSHSTSQQWFSGPGGELLNGNSGRCLADPASTTAHGARLAQENCYGEPGEIWAVS